MDKPLRVLLVFGKLNRGGAETLVMNIFRSVDRTRLVFDFVVHTDEECDYDNEVIQLGGKIYHFPRYNVLNHSLYCKEWNDFFVNHREYKIIHAHSTGSASVIFRIARKYGLITIAHSHTVSPKNGLRQIAVNSYRLPLKELSDYMFACSEQAGRWMFGDDVTEKENYKTIKNAIDLDNFSYCEADRIEVRNQLGIGENDFVVGNVARFNPSKNHPFLIDIFNELLKLKPEAKLMLVGTGEDENKIKTKVNELGINDNVLFLGSQSRVNKLLNAMDVFVLPSFYEGIPLSVIEAQANGLSVLTTSSISNEVLCTDLVILKSIEESASDWAREIISLKAEKPREAYKDELKAKGYDVHLTAKWLTEFYESLAVKKSEVYPKRVLLVFGKMNRGGAETLAMNIFRNVDRSKVVFDFIVHTNEHCDYDDEIIKLGGKIYHFPRYNISNNLLYVNKWKAFLDKHNEYKVLHAHNTGSAAVFIPLAKKKGIYCISHSHIAKSQSGLRQKMVDLYQLPLRNISDYLFACSKIAGEWLFGKDVDTRDNYKVITNGVDSEAFSYNEEFRNGIRYELNLGKSLVVVNVARFHIQKNHEFLIDVFNEILKKHKDSKLLLVGTGELEEKIREKAVSLGIADKVIFTGVRSDVNKILSAADVFCMPSFREGLPVSLVEAQAAGLPVVATDTISDEIVLTDLVKFRSLDDSPEKWADTVIESSKTERTDRSEEIKKAGYDIRTTARFLQDFYLEKYE